MSRIVERIGILTDEELTDLKLSLLFVFIMQDSSSYCLDKFVILTGLTKKQLIKWGKKALKSKLNELGIKA